MESRVALRPRILQDENVNIKLTKSAAGLGGQSRTLKTAPKKDGQGLVSRRALNDITNKSSSVSAEVQSKKKDDVGKKEAHVADHKEFNVAEERFLHDHSKCIEAQQAALNAFKLDLVLPGSDSISGHSNTKHAKEEVINGGPRCYPEPTELSMTEFSDWIDYSMHRGSSPPCSPIHYVHPLPWQFDEEVEFVLKQGDDA